MHYSQESGQTEKKPEVATGACFICLYHEKGWEFGMQHTDWIELSITRKECKMPLKLLVLLLLLSSSFNCWLAVALEATRKDFQTTSWLSHLWWLSTQSSHHIVLLLLLLSCSPNLSIQIYVNALLLQHKHIMGMWFCNLSTYCSSFNWKIKRPLCVFARFQK